MRIIDKNYTITTIYFDGQFWCALIEQNREGQNYAGRYVFGAEPSNPQLLHWMIHEFANIPLLPVDGKRKIRFRKLAKESGKRAGNIPKSFKAFSKAQKEKFKLWIKKYNLKVKLCKRGRGNFRTYFYEYFRVII